jgi:hypothetical protein
MKINYLIFIILVFSLIRASLIANSDEICNLFKNNIFKSIDLYKEMTTNNKKELYKHSLRDLAFEILLNVDFTDKELNIQTNKLLYENAGYFDAFVKFKKVDYSGLYKKRSKLETKIQKKFNELQANKLNLQKMEKKFDGYVTELKDLRKKLQKIEFRIKYEKYNELHLVFEGLQNEIQEEKSLLDLFDSYRNALIKIFPDDVVDVDKYKQYIKVFYRLEKYLKGMDLFKKLNLHVIFNKETLQRVKEAKTKKKKLSKAIQKYKKKCKENTLFKMKIFQRSLLKDSHYLKFKKIMKKGIEQIPKISKLRSKILTQEKQIKQDQFRLKLEFWKKARIQHEEFMEMDLKLMQLEEISKMIPENSVNDSHLTSKVKSVANQFYTDNLKRMDVIQSTYADYKEVIVNSKNLKRTGRQIDELLGKVLGSLQGEGYFKQCFTRMELSVVIYYSIVFQVVSFKTSFLSAFFNAIPDNTKESIFSRLFQDLQNKPLVDKKIINIQTRRLAKEGQSEGIRKYVMFMNDEMDVIFKEQRSKKEMIKGKVRTVFKYAKISAAVVAVELRDNGLMWIFFALASALSVFVGIGYVSVVISLVILGVVFALFQMISYALKKEISKHPNIMKEFMQGVVGLINRFRKNKVESLDYEAILEDHRNVMNKELMLMNKKMDDKVVEECRLEYFKEMFLKIVDMDVDYNSIDLVQVYNDFV